MCKLLIYILCANDWLNKCPFSIRKRTKQTERHHNTVSLLCTALYITHNIYDFTMYILIHMYHFDLQVILHINYYVWYFMKLNKFWRKPWLEIAIYTDTHTHYTLYGICIVQERVLCVVYDLCAVYFMYILHRTVY